MGELVEAQELYAAFEKEIKNIYFEVHAIYAPGNDSRWPDWYCAAVDLFAPGITFRVYFTLNNDRQIQFQDVNRWYFG